MNNLAKGGSDISESCFERKIEHESFTFSWQSRELNKALSLQLSNTLLNWLLEIYIAWNNMTWLPDEGLCCQLHNKSKDKLT